MGPVTYEIVPERLLVMVAICATLVIKAFVLALAAVFVDATSADS